MKLNKLSQKFKPQPGYLLGYRPLLLIFFTAIAVYLPTFWYGFSPMDEHQLILNNIKSLGNINNLFKPFSTPIFDMYYRPILFCSFMIDLIVGNAAPLPFHFTNVLLHALCCVFIFKVFTRLNTGTRAAFWCALIFAVHPINVHAVAWIPGRNDTLLCLFSLLSVFYLTSYLRNSNYFPLAIHFICLCCALLTKENAIVLPVLFGVIILLVLKRKAGRQIVLLSIMWVILIAVWFFLRKSIVNYFPAPPSGHFAENMANFVAALIIYIGKCILPIQQAVMPLVKHTSIIPGLISIGFIAFLLIKYRLKDRSLALLGISWFFLLIVISTWYGAQSSFGEHYEHRAYTAIIGVLLFVSQINFKLKINSALILLALLISSFAVKTIYRSRVYKDEFSYTTAGTAESPSITILHSLEGDGNMNSKNFRKAAECYTRAIELKSSGRFYFRRAQCYYMLKEYDKALEDFNQAIESFSKDKRYQNELIANYSEALLGRSRTRFFLAQYNAAMFDLNQARQLKSDLVMPPNYPNDLNKALQNENIVLYTGKINKSPGDYVNYYMRGIAHFNLGDIRQALPDFNKAIDLKPNDTELIYNRLQIFTAFGDKENMERDQKLLMELGFYKQPKAAKAKD